MKVSKIVMAMVLMDLHCNGKLHLLMQCFDVSMNEEF